MSVNKTFLQLDLNLLGDDWISVDKELCSNGLDINIRQDEETEIITIVAYAIKDNNETDASSYQRIAAINLE